MGLFLADLRQGVRMLGKHPGLTAIAVIALALGLGLTTTMWSITWGGILRGLPFENAEEIIHLERARPSRDIESYGVPMSDFVAWREQQQSFEDLSAFSEGTVNVSGSEGRPERFEGGFVTAATFRLLRVQPVLGRLFVEEEDRPGAPPVALIGWDLWQARFGGESAIVGRTLRANGVIREIVGVMPRGFQFPTNAQIWYPVTIDPGAVAWGEGNQYEVMGRLRPGVTMAVAFKEFEAIAARLAEEHPKENEGVVPILQPFTEEYIGDEPIIMLWTMMAAVFGVFLIACSNVANLLLARAATRTKEIAVRTALGASRWRIVSQLLAESLVLSVIGSLIGIVIAWVGCRLFVQAMEGTDPPFWIDIRLDGTVLAFAMGITVLAALISGIIPALQATRGNIHDVLKDESRGASSLRIGKFSRALVMVELALSGGLLVAAGFMIQSVVQRSRFDYGVPIEGIFTSRVGLFEATYPDSASHARFWNRLEQELQALPGQRGVALQTALPGLWGWEQAMGVEGRSYEKEQDYPTTRMVAVTPGWFSTFEVALLDGRVFSAGDIGGALPVAVVTRGFVAKHFPGEAAVGRQVRLGGPESTQPWLTIVGVVKDVWYDGTEDADEQVGTVLFVPVAQGDYRFLSIAVAAQGDPMSFAGPVQAAVSAVDPDQPMYFVRTLQEEIRRVGWFYGVFGVLFIVFGGAALFLATVGVYGVVSFGVSQRTREIGVRMALGASGRDVLGLFLRQGGIQVAIGLSLGLVLAFFLGKGLTLVLFQVNTANPLMYAGVTLALAATCLLATLIPARRALGVDPMEALRYE
jgi:predicted permease